MSEKKSFLQEFKEFAIQGNVLDLAVAVVIGTAFGKIVSSLVADIIMPIVGIILNGIDFTSMKYTVGQSSINYGNFIQSAFDFLIVAMAIFIFVKILKGSMGKMKKS